MSTASVPEQEVGHRDPKKAALSGWIGSALEYYDFALYSTVRGPRVPDGLLPLGQRDPRPHRFARHLRGRVFRPTHRRGRSGCLRRPARPQERPGLRDVPDGHLDIPGRRAAHLRAGRRPRADSARRAPGGPGLRRGRRARRCQRHDRGALPGRQTRLLRELQPAGHPGRLDPGHRRAASARRVPARRRVPDLGLADPVPAQRLGHPGRLHHPPQGDGAAGLRRPGGHRGQAQAAVHRPAAHPSVGNRQVHSDDLHQRDRLGDARLRYLLREPQRATASASPPATCSG